MTKFNVTKPSPAGKFTGRIHSDLSAFNEVRTRLFTGLQKCKTAEAYEVYENAINALTQVTIEFNESRKV